ncbi:MAG: tape measure protein [Marichromatium sp.]|nr:tape measure protein [Marichromatium sp.]
MADLSDLELKVRIAVDASAVESVFGQLGASLDGWAVSAQQAGRRAGAGFGVYTDAIERARAASAQLVEEGADAAGALGATDKGAGGASLALGKLGTVMKALQVVELAQQFVALNAEFETTQRALAQVLGGQQAAAEAMAATAVLADRLGQSSATLSQQYARFASATQDTALAGQASADVFTAVVGAMGTLGKSSAETEQALTAVARIADAGTVSAAQMRDQLGGALPGAMRALSEASGLTTDELEALLESGELLAADVLPLLAKGLNETFDLDQAEQVDTLGASVARLQNALSRTFTEVGQNGLSDVFTAVIDRAADGVEGLTAGTVTLGKNIGATAAWITGVLPSWEEYTAAIAENNAEGQAYLDRQVALEAASAASTTTLQQLATAALEGASAHAEAAKRAAENSTVVASQGEAALNAAAANLQLARLSGDAEQAMRAQAEVARVSAETSERLAEARAAETAVTTGHIAKIRSAIAELERLKTVEGAETEQIEQQIAVRQGQIAALQETAKNQQATAQEAQLLAVQERATADAARLAADTYGDQSAKLAELAAEHERLRAALEASAEAQRAGAEAQAQLADAEARARVAAEAYAQAQAQSADNTGELSAAAKAAQGDVLDLKDKIEAGNVAAEQDAELKQAIAENTARLADATSDLVAAKARELEAAERATEAARAESDARVTHLKNLAKEAEARGDTAEAARLNEEAARAEIDGIRALIAAREAELGAQQALLAAKQQEIAVDGEVTEEEQQQLDAQLAAIEATESEIQTLQEAVRHKRALAEANRAAASSAEAAAEETTDAAEATEALDASAQQSGASVRDLEQILRAAGVSAEALADHASGAAEAFQEAWNAFDITDAIGTNNYVDLLSAREEAAVRAAKAQIGYNKALAEQGATFAALNDQLDAGEIGLDAFADGLERLINTNQRLGEEELEPLRAALDDARRKMADFTESAQAGLRDLQAEWAELNGQQLEALLLEQEAQRLEIEMALAEAKRDGNTEAIRALEDQLEVLEQIQAVERERAAEAEAQAAIEAAEAEAEEAARRAALSDADRAHEDSIATLEARLLEAVRAQDQALEDALAAQIAAERQRHEETLANLEAESAARASIDAASTAGTTSGATGSTGTASASRAIDVRLSVNGASGGTVSVADTASADTLESFLASLETAAAVAA